MKKILLLLVLLAGCQRYEEGPHVALRSPEHRLCRSWTMMESEYNGVVTAISPAYIWTFSKDGTAVLTGIGAGPQFTWELKNKKKEIHLVTGNYIYVYVITRLTKDELWVSYYANNAITYRFTR